MSASDEESYASAEEGEGGQRDLKSAKVSAKGGNNKQSEPSSKGRQTGALQGNQKSKQQQRDKNRGVKKIPSETAKDNKSVKMEASDKNKSSKGGAIRATTNVDTTTQKKIKASEPQVACSAGDSIIVPVSDPQVPEMSIGDTDIKKEDPSIVENLEKESSASVKWEPDASSKQELDASTNQKPDSHTKTVLEIRENLKSSTATQESSNPEMQAIPRDDGAQSNENEDHPDNDNGGGSGWGWGWGSSILTAATSSLETFTSQVGEGLTTIIDTVESSLGVPDPDELARAEAALEPNSEPNGVDSVTSSIDAVTIQPVEQQADDKIVAEEDEDSNSQKGSGWLSGWGVPSLTSMGKSLVTKSQSLMNTGFEKAESLAAGGLDILETIGKKTYTTITEHDPGLRRAREFLHPNKDKPSLSTVLREAREQTEQQAKHEAELEEARKYNFTALLEDHQGLAHLEALEMLSNQSERKVQSLLSALSESSIEEVRPQLVEIKDIFQQAGQEEEKEQEESTEHDFRKLVAENLSELHLGTAPDKLNKVQESVRQWIADFYTAEHHSDISDPKEIQLRAMQSLAEVTSKAVEQFHKAGELVLMQKDVDKAHSHRAHSLAKLARVLVTEIDMMATKFSQCLHKIAEEKNSSEEVKPLVTSIYLEASNASEYIQEAFQLLLPVLQQAALQTALERAL